MLAEVITIGDELCRGEIVNTNASWLAEALWELQVTVAHMVSCRDIAQDMKSAILQACERSSLVILSGGLGPTLDDLTVDVVSELAGCEPKIDPASEARMRERFAKVGMPIVANATRQVRYPASGHAYFNSAGLAPGFSVRIANAEVIALPGPPRELKAIFADHVRGRILELRAAQGSQVEEVARRIYRSFGKGESQIAAALEGMEMPAGASLHYQVKFPETLVKVVARHNDRAASEKLLEDVDRELRSRLGGLIYGIDDDSLPAATLRELIARKQTLAVAESCTGGMIGSLLTAVPGSSAVFLGGAITYANSEKVRQLGVSSATLNTHGAVSEACVVEMARGIRERSGADWGIAVSGIAGPGGGSEAKPVGTVWIAVAGPSDRLYAKSFLWPSARDQIRRLAAHWAIHSLRRQLLGQES